MGMRQAPGVASGPPSPLGEGVRGWGPPLVDCDPTSNPSVANASGSSSFRAAARRSDFALVIAPEFDDILAERCEWAEQEGCRLLGPSVEAIRLTADKLRLAEHFTRAGVPTIPTVPFTLAPPWPPPYVIKPRYGAGSQDTFLVRDLVPTERPDTILQPYLVPRDGALSLACIGPMPLVLMRQTLSADGRFHYLGGEHASDVDDAPYRELARAAFDAVPGLAGYFGLDLLWPEGADRPVVVEINPRLTTSYVGLRALCEGNLMQTLLDAAQGREVAPPFRAGAVRFSLEELDTDEHR
jgi:predicted ATP-grasp superfamily ATP-dependent carboligase